MALTLTLANPNRNPNSNQVERWFLRQKEAEAKEAEAKESAAAGLLVAHEQRDDGTTDGRAPKERSSEVGSEALVEMMFESSRRGAELQLL